MRLLFFLLLINISLVAQLRLDDSISFNYTDFEIDKLGKLYALNNDSVVSFDQHFKPLFTYDHSSLGSIASFKASVSLKSLIFDENNQSIIFLDNSLTIQNQLNIPQDFGWVEDILWLDNGNFLIKTQDNHVKICDIEFKVLFDSGNLENLYGLHANSFAMFSDSDYIFLCSSSLQIQLDINGAFKSKYGIQTDQILFYHNGNLFLSNKQDISVYNLKALESISLEISKKVEDLAVFDDKIYLLSENMLYIYTIQ